LGIIIGANLVNRCASAQSSFPMCVTVYKYLIWKDFKEGVIPIGSSNTNELTQSGFEVKSGALKFPAVDINEGQIKAEGLMYYNNTLKKWRCCIKKSDGSLDWTDCGGGVEPWPNVLTAPVTIWRDANKTFKVLEISEQ
jgi:hypothetical protein